MTLNVNRAIAKVRSKAEAVVSRYAERIADNARDNVLASREAERGLPSALADSIHVERETAGRYRVAVRAAHAPFVEFGTSTQAAKPFLTPAVDRVLAER